MLIAGELELDRLKGQFQAEEFSDFFSVWLSGGFCGPMVTFGRAPHAAEALQSHRVCCAKVLAEEGESKRRKIPKRPGRKETEKTLGGKVSESSNRVNI